MFYQVYHFDRISLLHFRFMYFFYLLYFCLAVTPCVQACVLKISRLGISLSCQLKTNAKSEVTRRDKNITMKN